MGGKVLSRLRYIHRFYVEIQVDDPDRCSILDIFVELLEGAAKNGMFLPEEPTLWYTHDSQSIRLESDEDLMKMFNLLHDKKLINLAIGCAEAPCKNLDLARCLIESKKCLTSKTIEASNLHNTLAARSSHASMSLQSHPTGKKVPATSALRKGIYVPKGGTTSRAFDSHSSNAEVPSNVTVLSNVKVPSNVEVHFSGDAKDELQDEHAPDAYDDWEEDRGKIYFDDLYDNGEFYADYDFGKIKLREWMTFLNKRHLMDVVRDYCVQEGFFIVVIKGEQQRYTAECGDSNCEWRIHSSRLVDGVTWAIKSLKGTHTCMRLNLYNPMATPEWATAKILQDVRANEEITRKNINDLLFQKFGINDLLRLCQVEVVV